MDTFDIQQPVLLAEDEEVNLRILSHILEDRYPIVTARNGREAFDLLDAQHGAFAAIILDLNMPVMDGYTFLRKKAACPEYANLPVLVTTTENSGAETEELCLQLGAWDYTRKPYQARTIQLRLANIIARSRQSLYRQLAYVSSRDALTGLLNQQTFQSAVIRMLAAHPVRHFSLIRMDISRFGLINSLYGVSEGDALLRHMGNIVSAAAAAHTPSLCCRIHADIFCLFVPCDGDMLDGVLDDILGQLQRGISTYPAHYYLEAVFGVYRVQDPDEDPNVMYRKASLAAATCKNNYQRHIAYYDEALSHAQRREQRIANEMEGALANGQFVVYLQPKFDLIENRPCGAEALVRWQHPVQGMIPPDLFVPVFERNGFIPLVDHFMWEQVCILLRRWLDAGIRPYPVSVNVSRQNLYNPYLVEELPALVQKYNIPASLMQLELTESAYMDDPELMLETVRHLRESGFTMLMDDFGSHYSSLNALKDIPVDILKLDIGFLAPSPNLDRGRCILESVLHMADALSLPTIIEGIETAEQKQYLKSIGCRYAQGFYFAKPLPVPEYEALIADFSQN